MYFKLPVFISSILPSNISTNTCSQGILHILLLLMYLVLKRSFGFFLNICPYKIGCMALHLLLKSDFLFQPHKGRQYTYASGTPHATNKYTFFVFFISRQFTAVFKIYQRVFRFYFCFIMIIFYPLPAS